MSEASLAVDTQETNHMLEGAVGEEDVLSQSSESSSDEALTPFPTEDATVEDNLCGGFRLFRRPSSLLVDVEESSSISLSSAIKRSSLTSCLSWEKLADSSRTHLCASASTPSLMPSSPSFSWLLDDERTRGSSSSDAYTTAEGELSAEGATLATDLSKPRSVYIVTTAALPWMTGTSVNPLLRAAYLYQRYASTNSSDEEGLCREDGVFYDSAETEQETAPGAASAWTITLVIPWLERPEDRVTLYGADWATRTAVDQEAHIRTWLREKANQPQAAAAIQIQWYRARYYPMYRSIFATDDVCEVLNQQVARDPGTSERGPLCILEEPEHLFMYRAMHAGATTPKAGGSPTTAATSPPPRAMSNFSHVVGIMHTNYKAYAAQNSMGFVSEWLASALCAVVAQGYTDKIIKLSGTLQSYALHKETVCNVHGIRQDFLEVSPPTGNDVYFIGKLLWAKGLDKLLAYEKLYYKLTGAYFSIDIYGSGPDEEDIRTAFTAKRGRLHKRTIPATFPGRIDHGAIPTNYRIFCNPSITEVLCTVRTDILTADSDCRLTLCDASSHYSLFRVARHPRKPWPWASLS